MAGVPDHIPPELIVDFDAYDSEQFGDDPLQGLAGLHDKPNIFYTPRNGGHWVVIGAKEALAIVSKSDIFSANLPKYDRTVQAAQPYIVPLHADPPDHTMFRRILSPLFTPAAIREHEAHVRAAARRLVDDVADKGECEFVHDIARRFPVGVFLRLVGVPEAHAEEMLSWVDDITRNTDPERYTRGTLALIDFLKRTIEERRARPGDDLVSYLLAAEYGGRPADDGTVLSVCGNLFVGGLDTVVAISSFIMRFLGKRPDQRALLRQEPRPLRDAVVEELLRRNGAVTNARAVTRDFDLDGVPFRAGDRVDLMYQLMSTDPEQVPSPLDISYDRAGRANMSFGMGPHHCVGAHLARLEIRLLLEEWFDRIPEFETPPGAELPVRAGIVWAPTAVPLVWPRQA